MAQSISRLLHITALTLWDGLLALLALFGHPRARAFRAMRGPSDDLAAWAATRDPRSVLWIHCASLGEYEQARPVMAALRSARPDLAFLLTFFSPSGFEPVSRRKPDFWRPATDHLTALPIDRPARVRPFLAALSDRLALFATVKYEVWPVLLHQLAGTPRAIFAAHLPEHHWLSRPAAAWYRAAWRTFDPLLVQTPDSVTRLASIGIPGAIAAGDPRADRVLEIVDASPPLPALERWRGRAFCVVAGSTWPPEEEALIADPPERLLLAPHDLGTTHRSALRKLLRAHNRDFVFTSDLGGLAQITEIPTVPIVVVDEMGWLAGLYAHADVAVVGGGWGVGIHNVLEPAAHGKPIVTGPNISRFQEALTLRAAGALQTPERPEELMAAVRKFEPKAGEVARAYVEGSRGAAHKIASELLKQI